MSFMTKEQILKRLQGGEMITPKYIQCLIEEHYVISRKEDQNYLLLKKMTFAHLDLLIGKRDID